MQEAEEKTTDVFYRFRKRDILKKTACASWNWWSAAAVP